MRTRPDHGDAAATSGTGPSGDPEEPAAEAADETPHEDGDPGDDLDEDREDEAGEAGDELGGAAGDGADDADVDAGDPDDDAGDDPGEPGFAARIRDRVATRPLLSTAVAMVIVAAGCAVYFGGSWYAAAHDESLRYSQLRDSAQHSGEQAVQNLNSLDYRHVDQGLNIWLQSSTGDLHNSISSGRATFTAQVRKAKTVTTAKVLDSAITQLDDHAGTAEIIVALQITVTPATGKPATKQTRLLGELTRTGATWKLSKIGQVELDTGGAPAASPAPS